MIMAKGKRIELLSGGLFDKPFYDNGILSV